MASQIILNSFITVIMVSSIWNVSQGQVEVTGDVKIIGLFKVHELLNGECKGEVDVTSVMIVEAVKWYIEQLNDKGGLPLKIGFEAYETCGKVENAAEHAVRIINRVMDGEKIIGVIGPEYSSEAEAIAPILSTVPDRNKLTQVGFSTTAARLTGVNRFPNFVRVVSNDDVQVDFMIQSMVKLEWSRIAIVYEDNVYGKDMESALQMKAKQVGICIALSRQISVSYGINRNEVINISSEILSGTDKMSPIAGIVFIGSEITAKEVVAYITNQQSQPLPIIMFSEGSSLDKGIFTTNGGNIITKALGNLLLSPEYSEVQEFSMYWKSIFTNVSLFEAENSTNNWLAEVYYKLKGCDHCTFTTLSLNALDKQFNQQPPYLKYAILAAHTLVKGATLLHKRQCSTTQVMCAQLQNNFQSGDVLNIIRGMQINLETDFGWRLESLRGHGTITISNITGDSMFSSEVASYQIFNVQKNADIVFTNVGNLIGKSVSIRFDLIRDYDAQGNEILWPNVRKAQCFERKACSECIPLDDLQEGVLFEPGDIYVVGVAPVFQKLGVQSCGEISSNNGYLIAESIRFQVLQVSKRTGDFANFFPKAKVGVIVLNSCMSSAVIQRKILTLNKVGIRLANGTLIDLNNKIIGFIAEYSSTVSIAIADVLTPLRFVQISYASTSPALSDRSKYPYFMRVVTPDDKQAKAMVEIMIRLNVQYAQIVYQTGAYGEDGKNKVRAAAREKSICIAQDTSFNEDENVYAIYERLKRIPHAKVVVLFLYPHVLIKLASAITGQMRPGEFIFIGSESWARMAEMLDKDTNTVLLGSFSLSLEMYQDRELRQHIRNHTESEPFSTNPWSSLFIEERNKCFHDTSFDKTKPGKCSASNDFRTDPNYVLDTYDTTAFIATTSLLVGANTHLQRKCGPSTGLCADFVNDAQGLVDEIKKVKLDLDGTGTKMRVFDNNGDGNIGYRIYNIQKDPDNPQSLMYREIGRSPLDGTFTFEKDKIVYPTNEVFTSGCPNEEACSQCLTNTATGNLPVHDNNVSDQGNKTTVIVLGVFLAVFCLATILLAIKLSWVFLKTRLGDRDLYLSSNSMGSAETSLSREEISQSKIYMDIQPCPHERRFVRE